MSEDEIRKALQIIKQPITVNTDIYHYFDEENFNKLIQVYDNCLWFVNLEEQLIQTTKDLQKENQQLKETINKAIEYGELIDNRNTYIEISELRHLIEILKGDKE